MLKLRITVISTTKIKIYDIRLGRHICNSGNTLWFSGDTLIYLGAAITQYFTIRHRIRKSEERSNFISKG